jgi:hypothetical protein
MTYRESLRDIEACLGAPRHYIGAKYRTDCRRRLQ